MHEKQITGQQGEQRAVQYLVDLGFQILETNYRYKRAEIDIIAAKDNVLHFVEVKTRKNNDFGFPESFVSDRKVELFQETAEYYIEDQNWQSDLQFDIIAITLSDNSIEYFPEAF